MVCLHDMLHKYSFFIPHPSLFSLSLIFPASASSSVYLNMFFSLAVDLPACLTQIYSFVLFFLFYQLYKSAFKNESQLFLHMNHNEMINCLICKSFASHEYLLE